MLFRKSMEYYAWLHNYTLGADPSGAWALYAVPDPNVNIHWWSYPTTHAVETVSAERLSMRGEWIIPMGVYELRIKNGVKELRLNE